MAASVWIASRIVIPFGRRDLARAGRDDAGRHRAVEAERVADGHHAVAHLHLGRRAERDRGQRGGRDVRLQQRDVGGGVGADHPRADASLFENDT